MTIELIRRGRLREEYSLIWLLSALILIVLPFLGGASRTLADLFGIGYPPSLVFLVSIILLTAILIHHSTTISTLSSRSRDLAQKLAILEMRLYELHQQSGVTGKEGISIIPLKNLLHISRELRQHMQLPDLLNYTLEIATQCVNADSGSLMIFDENQHLIRYLLAYGGQTTAANVQEPVDTVENGLAGWVLENHRPALIRCTSKDPRWIKRPWDEQEGDSRSAICVPLETQDQVIGVLTVVNPNEGYFTETDLIFLTNVATIISQTGWEVLANAYLNATTRRAEMKPPIEEYVGGVR